MISDIDHNSRLMTTEYQKTLFDFYYYHLFVTSNIITGIIFTFLIMIIMTIEGAYVYQYHSYYRAYD